jgi:autoinducer 2-degrading protein
MLARPFTGSPAMFIVAVTILVKPEFVEQFIPATFDNASNTRKEPGNIRFDVSQSLDDPARFFLYEVYHTPDDFKRHQETPHYLRWKQLVADWMAQPRQGIKHKPLFFGDEPVAQDQESK